MTIQLDDTHLDKESSSELEEEMGDVVFETTENGLVPHSAWAGCSSHVLLEDLPNLRKRNPMNPGNYKSFMVHMSRLRLFSIDKHFVKA